MIAAVDALRRGEAVGLPTETVYGLAADARNEAAIARVFELKGRPRSHPLIVHIQGVDVLEDWALEIPDAARRLAARFWPGPLTLVLRRHPSVLDAVTGGQPTVALRVPAHPVAQAVLNRFGCGLVAPSANRFGHVSPTTARHVRDEFGADLPLVIDGGECSVGIESSIVDLSGEGARLLRPGMLSHDELEAALGAPLEIGAAMDSPRVPGNLERHYAPNTPMQMQVIGGTANLSPPADSSHNVGLLACGWLPTGVRGIALPLDPEAYARGLYAALRKLDDAAYDSIEVVSPPDTPAWLAIRDRLRRACTGLM